MKINSTAAKHIKKYCYIIGLLSFLIAFFACSQMLRYQEKEKKASGTYMAQSTIRRVKAKLDNYIMISDFLGNYIIDGSDMDRKHFLQNHINGHRWTLFQFSASSRSSCLIRRLLIWGWSLLNDVLKGSFYEKNHYPFQIRAFYLWK